MSHSHLIRAPCVLVVVRGHSLTIVNGRFLLPTTIMLLRRQVAVGFFLQMIRLLLLVRHKLEALCVVHGRSILYRLALLVIKESYLIWVQIQDMLDLVADIDAVTLVAVVF